MGDLDGAIADLDNLAETRFAEARARGFDYIEMGGRPMSDAAAEVAGLLLG